MAFQSKKTNSKPLNMKLVSIMSALLVLSSVGSLVGTYSWYEYTTRAGLNYHGTAVGHASGMTIGLYSKYVLYEAAKYGLTKDPVRDGLYWTNDNKLSSDAIMYFSEVNMYAGNMLQPVTSGKYKTGDNLFLKSAPFALHNYDLNSHADSIRYAKLPLAFKIDGKDSNKKPLTNECVYLSNIQFEGEGSIKNGLRLYFDNGNGDSFIFNPASSTNGYDVVGGVLDLDIDGYHDFETQEDGTKIEYIYGEVVGEPVYNKEVSGVSEPEHQFDRNTFNGVSKEGVYACDLNKTTFEKANYLGTRDVIGTKPLGYIDDLANVIRVDTTIYAEGWSPYVSFKGIHNDDSYFNLTIDFELGSK